MLERLSRGAQQDGLRLRSHDLGNYAVTAPGYRPKGLSKRFAFWSDIRLKAAPAAAGILSFLLLGNVTFAAATWRQSRHRGRLLRLALLVFAGIAILEFVVCALADHLGDLARHLFVFHAICDLLVIADIAWLIQTAAMVKIHSRQLADSPR